MKILIATTNPGKFSEIVAEYSDLPFTFLSLSDLKLGKTAIEEPYQTTWENAVHKAKFFAKKTNLITIAEDSAFCVDYLQGEPGIKAKRFATTDLKRNTKILNLLKGVPTPRRGAFFETSACVYDPKWDHYSVFKAKCHGIITQRLTGKARDGLGYDSIFFYPALSKTFAQMTTLQKNLVSHRGKVSIQVKYFLQRHYGARQMVVPCALLIKDRKILLLKRRDQRSKFNNKWEFPGGAVESGEDVEGCLKGETKEETGFAIEIIEQLPKIYIAPRQTAGNFQIFLIFYVCRPLSGALQTTDVETAGALWLTLKEALKLDFLPLNKKVIRDNLTLLKKYVD